MAEELIEGGSFWKRKWRGVVSVIGGVLIHLTLGTYYTFGMVTPPAAPHDLRYVDSKWILTGTGVAMSLTMFIGGVVERKLGPRITPLIGGWFFSLGVLLTYFTIKSSFLLTILTYGVMYGVGIGMAYNVPVACSMKWFPKRPGMAGGFVVAGFGGAAFIFNQVQTAYLNPNNLSPNVTDGDESYFGQPEILDKKDLVPVSGSVSCDEEESEKELLIQRRRDVEIATNIKPLKMLRTREFYMLVVTLMFMMQAITFIAPLYKAYGLRYKKDDHFLTLVGAIASVLNSAGRPMWGYLGDRFSYRISYGCLCGLFAALMLTLNVTEYALKPFFFVWICLIFLTFSGNFALMPMATAKAFGSKHFATNYGLVFTMQAVTPILGTFATTQLKGIIGWEGMFFLIAGYLVVAMFLALAFPRKGPSGQDV